MTAFDEYQSLRTTFAVYPRGRAVARVSGPEREGFLSGLLARTVEFSGPGTLLESLVLDEEGRPIDQVLVLVEDDDLLVLSDDPARFLDSLATEADSAGNVTVEILPGATSLAVEGPAAWRAVAALVNGEIATLALGEFVPVHIDGVLEDGKLARTGTTGEYGYVLTGRCDADQLRAYLLGAVKNAVGVEIGRQLRGRAPNVPRALRWWPWDSRGRRAVADRPRSRGRLPRSCRFPPGAYGWHRRRSQRGRSCASRGDRGDGRGRAGGDHPLGIPARGRRG